MIFEIEIEQEEDGRWIAEIPDLPGAMQYDQTAEQATAKAQALALRIIAERIESGKVRFSEFANITFNAAWTNGKVSRLNVS